MPGGISRRLKDRFYYWAYRRLVRTATRKKRRAQEEILRNVTRRQPIWLLDTEISQLIECVQRTQKVSGDIAEVGTYEGATAKLIAQVKGQKPLHLFDTFEGMPEVSSADGKLFFKGQFTPNKSLEDLKAEFQGYPDTHLYAGVFPAETSHFVADRRFAFVHLDVDIYQSTLDSLGFFYPRMNPGAIILSHDYGISEGVRKAFDEFFADRTEPVIPVAGSQCLVVKSGECQGPA